MANRGKRSVASTSRTRARCRCCSSWSRRADVVQHNMRYDAALRLGVDYESLQQINRDLVYCHTRGFERGRARELPGNDQTGAAWRACSTRTAAWADGGKPSGRPPRFGDTGNGFLSAIGIIQALYHREDRGGAVRRHVDPQRAAARRVDGLAPRPTGPPHRPQLDAMQLGCRRDYSLYEAADGWMSWWCRATARGLLLAALGHDGAGRSTPASPTSAARATHRRQLEERSSNPGSSSRSATEAFGAARRRRGAVRDLRPGVRAAPARRPRVPAARLGRDAPASRSSAGWTKSASRSTLRRRRRACRARH